MAATLAFFFLVPSPTGTLQEATNPGNYGISHALTQPSTYKNPVAPLRPPLFISAPRSRQASPRPCDWISSRSRERHRCGTFYPWPCQRNRYCAELRIEVTNKPSPSFNSLARSFAFISCFHPLLISRAVCINSGLSHVLIVKSLSKISGNN